MTGLSIGKVVYNILSSDKSFKEVIGNRIYPLIADEGTIFPFVIYSRIGIDEQSTKDSTSEQIRVLVQVAANNYQQSIETAEIIRAAMEHKSGTFNNLLIEDIILEDASEDWLDDTFIQNLNFNIYYGKN